MDQRNVVRKQMNDSWHIPRASLVGSTTGSSSNGSSKSNSNPPTVTRLNSRHLLRHHRTNDTEQQSTATIPPTLTTHLEYNNTNNNKKNSLGNDRTTTKTSRYNDDNIGIISNNRNSKNHRSRNRTDDIIQYHQKQPKQHHFNDNKSTNSSNNSIKELAISTNIIKSKNTVDIEKGGIKRGSRSSQGSTDSHSSSRSASSGSLLLTAANLERFVAIHNKNNQQQNSKINPFTEAFCANGFNYNTNITYSQNPILANNNNSVNMKSGIDDGNNLNENHNSNDIVLDIDPNLHFIKTKDIDTISIASSTHFTMVNGMGGPQKKIRSGICSRGHQITVLILTMSGFFMLGIMLMVYLMEMRAREMPQQ